MTQRTGEDALQARIEEEVQARMHRLLDLLRHELRTPIGSILTLADLLNEHAAEPSSSNQAEYLDAIRQSAETALNIVQNLAQDPATLGLEGLAGAPLMHRSFALTGFLAGLEAHHGAMAETKGLSFRAHHGEGMPERITAPLTAWRQIIDNLLSNAIKYTTQGEIGLRVELEDNALGFHITDTGPGLQTAGGEKLFDAYARGTNSGTAQGQGLGLAVVKALTMRCEGALSFRSQPGEGTHFYLRLPFSPAATEQPRKQTQGKRQPRGKKILVVEDNPINRMLIDTLLDKFGHTATQAGDGTAALELTAHNSYDLVLMDIELPNGMNGFDVAEAMRAQPGWKGTPIIALSAHDGPQMEERILRHGLQGFVNKPLSARALYTAIEGLALAAAAKA